MSELLLTCRQCGSAEGSRVCERCRRLRTYDPTTHRAISVAALQQLAFATNDRLAEIERIFDIAKGEAWLKVKRDETRAALAEARSLLEEHADE